MTKESKQTQERRQPIVICICGMAGSGKSTQAKHIAGRYGLRYFSGGDALKALALEEGYRPLKRGWWESPEGLRFLSKRRGDPKFDEKVDKKLLELAEKGNVVLDSWTMPWLLKEGFKIWLQASPSKRAERIAKRDRIGLEEAVKALVSKEEQTRSIYKKLYGFSLGEDFTPFHLVLDTDSLTAREVSRILFAVIDNAFLNRKVKAAPSREINF